MKLWKSRELNKIRQRLSLVCDQCTSKSSLVWFAISLSVKRNNRLFVRGWLALSDIENHHWSFLLSFVPCSANPWNNICIYCRKPSIDCLTRKVLENIFFVLLFLCEVEKLYAMVLHLEGIVYLTAKVIIAIRPENSELLWRKISNLIKKMQIVLLFSSSLGY